MRKDRFQQLIASTFTAIRDLTATKGQEYSNTAAQHDADQHANFKRLAAELGLTPEKVLSVYLTKHLDSIKSFIRTGAVLSEPIEGRIDDAILYLILLKGLVADSHKAAEESPT